MKRVLGWEAKVSFEDLIVMMVEGDLRVARGILDGIRGELNNVVLD